MVCRACAPQVAPARSTLCRARAACPPPRACAVPRRDSRRALLAGCVALPLLPAVPAVATPAPVTKRTGLSDEQVRDVLASGLADGQYFVNADGMPVDVFDDACRFKDPTNNTAGLQRYLTALDLLFDPAKSRVRLLSIAVTAPRQITARWTLGGELKLPWRPRVPEFEGAAVYTLSDQGLVVQQEETWSISPLEALRETFTPGG